ncbi:hypothetical protein DDZ14_10610 [Maritimibacter sp. 55A14]|uniref:sulfite exporter TauE/SafE family protein n=1 Tax=Maritimibacter sp. 55A14 TaxID=2174844 RepID=UPI000D612825|nr:sulfite exporter TauE/SafE family protein [Maritimibacter sp. 55A14]PWE32501.1 hypothetical protein DDZ14_10610 [Maritimibacter sp. 55A14]
MVDIGTLALLAAAAITVAGGFVKGAVGFAMPMIMISGMASFLSPEIALAGLILPTLATNLAQTFRDGVAPAWAAFRGYWRLNLILMGVILLSAQLVVVLPQAVLLACLGVPMTAFAVTQLLGWQIRFRPGHRRRAEVATGLVAGFFGGLSGVWGPPIIAFLVSLDLPKREHVRVQGVCYLAGSILLVVAHLRSGVLNADTLPFSALLILPAFLGLWGGFAVQDRIAQKTFRRATLVVLMLAGLNLIRRALTGV